MREDLLHFIWKYRKFPSLELKTTDGELLSVLSVGTHNMLAGPDFFNAQIKIDDQLWAGNVEIHVNSSDWYAHKHEDDKNYDNVILHVVYEDDIRVHRGDGSVVPTLELKAYINDELLQAYEKLFEQQRHQFINCGKDIKLVSNFKWDNWVERLYIERLEQKSEVILELLKTSQNDWEKVLFVLLLKNFGSKINGDVFYNLGTNLDFSIIRKLAGKPLQMESLLLGLAKLLESEEIVDSHFLKLKEEFNFLKHKHNLEESTIGPPAFFKLRPSNFPTIRLSQIARLYAANPNMFHKLIEAENSNYYEILKVTANPYWDNHYTFGKVSKTRSKTTSKKFVDLLIINAILPIKFCYLKYKGLPIDESFIQTIRGIASESNNIIQNYEKLGVPVESAEKSQALLQLYNNYCTKNKCLQCVVGSELLNLKP
ncbi:DUF2851 family protein [Maribacter aestuarii]|uniref:DUF2851 family protein n=1 Tax=Maribacter aestuarii TaxID=1130723 RepID=UPI00248A96C6|nr:DUF2851 family protein [Maribacter aestuarii]